MLRNPRFIVRLGTARDGRSISTSDADLIAWVDLLAAAGRGLGALAAFAAATLLGEERADPGVVNEVADAAEAG